MASEDGKETYEQDIEDGTYSSGDRTPSNGQLTPKGIDEKPLLPPPDVGHQAWMSVVAGWCCLFVSFGWMVSIGSFEAYYKQGPLKSYSLSSISWILSFEVFMLLVPAPIFGAIFDSYGPRMLLLVGTFFHTFGLMMLSLSDKYYQIFLSQSICSALGASAMLYAGNNAVATWFMKRRGLALSIAVSGSGVGGIVFPVIITELIPRVGFGWAIRIIGFIVLALGIVANLTCSSRLQHQPKRFSVMLLIGQLKDTKLLGIIAASFFFFWGFFLPTNYLATFARQRGLSEQLSNYQIVIYNAASVIGRLLPGWPSDKFGKLNVTIVVTVVNTILVTALWINAQTQAAVIAFSAVYGLTSGAFISMPAPVVAQVSEIQYIGVRIGCTFFFVGIAALTGNPIGGALVSQDGGGYGYLQAFCGVCMGVGTILFIVARIVQGGLKPKVV